VEQGRPQQRIVPPALRQSGARSKGTFGSFADAAAQGPTLVIVRSTNGFTFGGYAAAAWNGTNAHISAAGSFVFWVENPQGRAPGCLDCANPAYAMYCNSSYGPIFDAATSNGCMFICPNNDPANCHINPTPTYPDTTGLGVALFTGASQFTLEDYEVWAVT
jgi:hypothetical protein